MKYLVILYRRAGDYRAWVPDLPGCVAVGRTRKEAATLIDVAIRRHIAVLMTRARPCRNR
jgi:predicted RNase H-like HicB family nuclease